MKIVINNKKILAGMLCLSITAGQANAINWGSVGSTIGSAITNFGKSAIKDFKTPTWQNSKWLILTSSVIAATYAISYKLKKMSWQWEKNHLDSKTKKQVIAITAFEATILYALSPIAFNLKYIYKPLTAFYYLVAAYEGYELISLKIKQWQAKKAKKLLFAKILATKKIDYAELIENKNPIDWIIENKTIIDYDKNEKNIQDFTVLNYNHNDKENNISFKSDKLPFGEIVKFRGLKTPGDRQTFIDNNGSKMNNLNPGLEVK